MPWLKIDLDPEAADLPRPNVGVENGVAFPLFYLSSRFHIYVHPDIVEALESGEMVLRDDKVLQQGDKDPGGGQPEREAGNGAARGGGGAG